MGQLGRPVSAILFDWCYLSAVSALVLHLGLALVQRHHLRMRQTDLCPGLKE